MPKVFLTEQQKQSDLILRILFKYMGAMRITTVTRLANNMHQNTDRMLRRFREPTKLTIAELRLIARYLHIPDDELLQILKGGSL